jgi:hypothetical protein
MGVASVSIFKASTVGKRRAVEEAVSPAPEGE